MKIDPDATTTDPMTMDQTITNPMTIDGDPTNAVPEGWTKEQFIKQAVMQSSAVVPSKPNSMTL